MVDMDGETPRSPHLDLATQGLPREDGKMRSVIAITVGALVLPAAAPHFPPDGHLAWRSPVSVHGPSTDRLLLHDVETLDESSGSETTTTVITKPVITKPLHSHRTGTTPEEMSELHEMAESEIRVPEVQRCQRWEPLLAAAHEKWDVIRMSMIMWRESRCQPGVYSPDLDSGLLQINPVNHEYLSRVLQRSVTAESLTDPFVNIAAAAALCDFWKRRETADCYQPWITTDPGPRPTTTSAEDQPAQMQPQRAFSRSPENAPV
jgi:hypothetical protein